MKKVCQPTSPLAPPPPIKKKKNRQAPTPDFFLDSRMESMSKFIFSVKDLLLNQHYNN